MIDDDQLTAYHEAGHVVMAWHLGARVVRASIVPADDDGPNRFGETVLQWRTQSDLEICQFEVAVSLAGPVAEMLYRNEDLPLNSEIAWGFDWSRATDAARRLSRSETQMNAIIEQGERSIRRFFDTDNGWAAVAAIADLLLAHETIEHDHCDQIIGFWFAG